MSKFRVGAIVPVKTFSRAKTRLNLSEEKTEQICSIMLHSVLSAISQSNVMEETVIVSKDESALNMGKKFGARQIYDQEELGVNNAVMLGDSYFVKEDFDLTIVFPQDIPLIQPEDIRMLFEMKGSNRCVLVVPSRKFDGTNALLRMPADVMATHYDEDSYKIHLNTAEKKNATSALILIPRIMLDVDDEADLRLALTRDFPVSKSLESVFKS